MDTRIPTLTDGSVTLRGHREDDVPRLVEQCVDADTVRWTTVPSPYSLDDARGFLRHVVAPGWREDTSWSFAVEYDDRYVGTVEIRSHGPGRGEIAYVAHPDSRGTGAMERGCRLALEWAFEERDLQSVVWWANRGNFASRRLAWKLGFTVTGPVRRWLTERDLTAGDGSLAPTLVDGWEGFLTRGEPMTPAHPWLEAVTVHGTTSSGESVTLRDRRSDDADVTRMVEACQDGEIRRWLGSIPSPYTAEMARDFLVERGEDMAAGRSVFWAIADADDRLVGLVNLLDVDRSLRRAEVGYWIHPDARGRGVARAATRLAVRHAFVDEADGGLDLQLVTANVADGNDASVAVLRGCGFEPVGHEQNLCVTGEGPTAGTRFQLSVATGPAAAPPTPR